MFQYPGGKSHLAGDIIDVMPHHECYVEGFGGSAALLLNKPKAEVNVYNDLDSDLVHFFTVFREKPEELIEKVKRMPYSSEYYHKCVDWFYEGKFECDPLVGGAEFNREINDCHVMRAAVFFYLRYTQFGAKYHGRSGFGRSKVLNQAETFANARERLREFMGFWDDVTIENVSYEKLIDSYDSKNTFFYFDPPYIGTEGYYRESDFDHEKFCKDLASVEGYWIVSYDEIPEPLKEYNYTQQSSTNYIDSGVKGESKDTKESFIFNYDPDEVRGFVGGSGNQTGFEQFDNSAQTEEEVEESVRIFDDEEDSEDWLNDVI